MMEFENDMWEESNTIPVKVKLLSETAKLPTYGSENAACCDLYADILSLGVTDKTTDCKTGETTIKKIDRIYLAPGATFKIPTGLAFEPPKRYCCLIYARSGIATKKGLRPANCVGVVDNDFTGNIIVAVHNDSNETQVIEHGDRVAQLMFVPYIQAKFEVADNLTETDRGEG